MKEMMNLIALKVAFLSLYWVPSRVMAFQVPLTFSFAPNGLCLQPHYFVDVQDTKRQFTMQNVPGEGDCVFMAVALATASSMGLSSLGAGAGAGAGTIEGEAGGVRNDALLQTIARDTRETVASVMESDGNLLVEGKRLVTAKKLLKSAAKSEGLSPEDYLLRLRTVGKNGGLYGGGPELTVLSNILRRPISVYEIHQQQPLPQSRTAPLPNSCSIHCVGTFGKGLFDDPCAMIPGSAVLSSRSWHLHILILDVQNGEKHACVLLPETVGETANNDSQFNGKLP